MYEFKLFFSFQGCIGRFEFAWGLLASIGGSMVLMLAPQIYLGLHGLPITPTWPHDLLIGSGYLLGIAYFLTTYFALATKRLRDLQWQPWLLAGFTFPITAPLMCLFMMALPGKLVPSTPSPPPS